MFLISVENALNVITIERFFSLIDRCIFIDPRREIH